MASAYTADQMAAQELRAREHVDLLTSDRSRTVAAALEHERGIDIAPSIVSPVLLGARVAYIADTREVVTGGLVQAIGHAGPEAVQALRPASSALAPPQAAIGTVTGPSFDGTGKELQIPAGIGITGLFGGAADFTLCVVAKFPTTFTSLPFVPLVWSDTTEVRLYLDGVAGQLVGKVKFTSGVVTVSAPIVPAEIKGTTALIELESRSGVLTVRIGAITLSTASLAVTGTVAQSNAVIRVGSTGNATYPELVLGEIVSFARALTAAELQKVRLHAHAVFDVLVPGSVQVYAPPPVVAPTISISGTRGLGLSLTTSETDTTSRQWQRGSMFGGGGTWSNIGGATATTYVEDFLDAGFDLRCVATGPGGTANSNTLGPISLATLVARNSPALLLDERGQSSSAWNDQSGNGRNFSQGSGSAQPGTTRTINGFAALDFDGLDDFLERTATLMTAYLPTQNTSEVLAVVQQDALVHSVNANGSDFYSGDNVITDFNGFWGLGLGSVGGAAKPYFGTGYQPAYYGAVDTVTAALTTPHLLNGWQDAVNNNLRCDSASVFTKAIAGNQPSDRTGSLVIGKRYLSTGQFDGLIACVVLFSSALSAQDRGDWRAFLSNKYALGLTS